MNTDKAIKFTPESNYLKDRVILITGAGDGIGKALAMATASYGSTVVLLGKTIKKLENVYDQIEKAGYPQAAIYPMDIAGATDKDYADLVDTLRSKLERLDGLILNAGWMGAFRPFAQITPELYHKTMTINLHSPFLMTQHCLPLLQESGNQSSVIFSTHKSDKAYCGAFGTAKKGLEGLMNILAHEYSGDKPVTVNAIDTGAVNTSMRRNNFPGEDWSKLPNPEDIVNPYLYLLDPNNQETGQHIVLGKN